MTNGSMWSFRKDDMELFKLLSAFLNFPKFLKRVSIFLTFYVISNLQQSGENSTRDFQKPRTQIHPIIPFDPICSCLPSRV